ncbi:WG repeat-containing protein [Fulvivirga lutea]|uniref:WG repeat-containing protein n=1 Tax=Fulvivirga lutea TaxID=2810512 RepID=A0A974WI42_9BACT|nr:WG repeat-containing protein [Fulvivirga lutea]QSE98836.1 WG repeat-containing protein [Fulvivirga lutea]
MRLFFRVLPFLLLAISSVAQSSNFDFVYDNGKVGLADSAGTIVIPTQYDQLGWSYGSQEVKGTYLGFRKGSYWGLITTQNEVVVSNQYSQLYPAGSELFVAAKKGKYSHQDFLGMINSKGKVVLPFKYTSITLSGLRAIVSMKSGEGYLYGIVDMGGKTILPVKYKEISSLGNLRYAIKNHEDKYAIYTDSGREIMGFTLDSISRFHKGHAIIYDNHLRGIISSSGQIIADPQFKDVQWKDEVQIKKFNSWEFISKGNGNKVWNYDKVALVGDNLFKVTSNNREWIVDKTQNLLSSPTYSNVELLENGSLKFRYNNKWGVVSSDSSIVLSPTFDSLVVVNTDFYALKNGFWSIYDRYGVEKSTQNYQAIGQHYGNYFAIKKNNKWGFLNREGEEIIHCVYDEIGDIQHGKVVVKFHGQYGILNKQGDWVVLPQNGRLQIINDKLYLVKTKTLTTLKSFDDETIYFTENRVEVKEDHLLEYLSYGGLWKIDFGGRIVNRELPQQKFEEIRASSNGLFAVKINNRYGFVDHLNRLIIANRYEDVGDFKEDLMAVKLIGKWGFIDRYENIVIQPTFQSTSDFESGMAVVQENGKYGLIDKKGNKLSAFVYDGISRLPNGKFLAEKDGKLGMLAKDGSLMIHAKYQQLEELSNGEVKVKLFDKYGVLTGQGVDIIPVMYDQLIYDHRFDQYLAMKKSEWENLSN